MSDPEDAGTGVQDRLVLTPQMRVADAAAPLMADEAAVRRMVAEAIRQELQGALGERITRNLRKLIEAEVARALTEARKAEARKG